MQEMKARFVVLYSIIMLLCWPLAVASPETSDCMNSPTGSGNPRNYILAWMILPGEISPDSSETVSIIGRLPPFSWLVNGYGFHLESSDGIVNTLRADEDACGSAEITVTDNLGNFITGYVRCTAGEWGESIEGCILAQQPDLIPESLVDANGQGKYRTIRKILGKYRQTQTRWGPTSRLWGPCPHDYCDEFCASSVYCHPAYGCDPCLLSEEDLPCRNAGYINTSCPPSCRMWCFCTTEYFYQEWICKSE